MSMIPTHPPQARRQHGFTLLEILVAIVVLSLGLLGLASLQALSLNNNQIAYYRGIATQQTYDMADRIRANLTGVAAGSYDNPAATAATIAGVPGSCPGGSMAATDYCEWRTINAALLPGGGGTVRCDVGPVATCANNTAGSKREFLITVTWTEKTALGISNQSLVTRFAP